MDVLRAGDELGGYGNATSCFDLVACQHPDLDAGIAK